MCVGDPLSRVHLSNLLCPRTVSLGWPRAAAPPPRRGLRCHRQLRPHTDAGRLLCGRGAGPRRMAVRRLGPGPLGVTPFVLFGGGGGGCKDDIVSKILMTPNPQTFCRADTHLPRHPKLPREICWTIWSYGLCRTLCPPRGEVHTPPPIHPSTYSTGGGGVQARVK